MKNKLFLILFIILSITSIFYMFFLYKTDEKPINFSSSSGYIYKSTWNKEGELLFVDQKNDVSVLIKGGVDLSENILTQLSEGEYITFKGSYCLPDKSTNEGEFDYRNYLLSKGVKYYAFIDINNITINENHIKNPIIIASKIRQDIYKKLNTTFEKDLASFILAVMTGDTGGISNDKKELMRLSGISHLLAVSGTHVIYILMPFKKMFKNKYFGIAIRCILLLIPLFLFVLIADCTPSVMRAAITTSGSLFSKIIEKKDDKLNNLGLAGCIQLLRNPFSIVDAGLILSYAAAFSIYAILPLIKKRFKQKKLNVFITGVAINAVLMPLNAYMFNHISIMGLLLNLVAAPLANIICICGYIFYILSKIPILFFFGKMSSFFLQSVSYSLTWLSITFGKIPEPFGSITIPSPNVLFIVCYYILMILILIRFKKRKSFIVILEIICVIFMFIKIPIKTKITFFDVGQGNSAMIQTSDGVVGVIDSGDGKTDISSILFKQGINQIDWILLTHDHSDHSGGLIDIIKEHKVKFLIISDFSFKNENNIELLNIAKSKNIQIINVSYNLNLKFKNNCNMDLYFREDKYSVNNSSIVMQLKIEGYTLLFTGDVESETENLLVNEGILPDCDIMSVAHHGGETSSNIKFLKSVKPEFAIISVGKGNSYGHPSEITLEKLYEINALTYRTDYVGSVTIFLSSKIKIKTYK